MSEKLKVLIVDDSTMIIKTIQKYLSKYDLGPVVTANNGQEALEVFKTQLPDIVTLDITMPKMDGLTVLEKMIELDSNVNIILITALNDPITKINAIKMGAKAYLDKPFTEQKFDDVMKEFLL